jgi:hypothetical protein
MIKESAATSNVTASHATKRGPMPQANMFARALKAAAGNFERPQYD